MRNGPRTAVRLRKRSLQIRFESQAALREEFEKNIAKRGIFIATEEAFEIRQRLEIEIMLSYVEGSKSAFTLLGEVVHRISVEMKASGAVPGIAVQFDRSVSELCDAFEPLLGRMIEPGLDRDGAGSKRRASERGGVRVPVRIMPSMSPPFEATSRDLSATGILLTMRKVAIPVGEIVRTCLWHPSGEPSVEIDGKVVRQVCNKSGQVAAVAVAFDRNQSADPRVRDVIDALRQAGHRSRLGGISGSIMDLGLANMLQMFGSSAPQGTLVVECDGEQGWVAFADGQFLGAELGVLTGRDALVAMLDWGEGRFQFEAAADAKLIQNATPYPLQAAVLEAVCVLDERAQASDSEKDELKEPVISIDETTTFAVDLEQEEASRSSFEKMEEAVLELAKSGMPIERLKSIIPEPADEVQSALEGLVELGVLVPR